MSNLSPSTLALLRAAKNDAPSKESRNAIWGGVTSGLVTHTPLHVTPQANGAGASAAPSATSLAPQAAAATAKGGMLVGASLTGMKGAFIGALFGSAISIGVATFMLRAKPVEAPRAPLTAQAAAQAAVQVAQVGDSAKSNGASSSNTASSSDTQELDALLPSTTAESKSGSSQNSGTSAIAATPANHASSAGAKSMTDDTQSLRSKKSAASDSIALDDSFTREISLVTQARDLLASNPAAALKAVRMARSLDARQLEPEEMKIEAKALRALGRDTDAEKIESQRHTMYPNAL